MTIRPPTFEECERLAIFHDNHAEKTRVYAETAGSPDVRRRYYDEVAAFARTVEILSFIGMRESRLHLLLEPASPRERRYG